MRIEELHEAFDKSTYYQSFDGRIRKMWETASRRTRNKGHKGKLISQSEFFDYASKDATYKKLYNQWEDSGFQLKLTPTLDRKDAKKGYVKGNLQFLTYSDNVIKGNLEYDKRPWEASQIKVCLERGKQKRNFSSMAEAAKFLGVNKSTVTRAFADNREIDGWRLTQGK